MAPRVCRGAAHAAVSRVPGRPAPDFSFAKLCHGLSPIQTRCQNAFKVFDDKDLEERYLRYKMLGIKPRLYTSAAMLGFILAVFFTIDLVLEKAASEIVFWRLNNLITVLFLLVASRCPNSAEEILLCMGLHVNIYQSFTNYRVERVFGPSAVPDLEPCYDQFEECYQLFMATCYIWGIAIYGRLSLNYFLIVSHTLPLIWVLQAFLLGTPIGFLTVMKTAVLLYLMCLFAFLCARSLDLQSRDKFLQTETLKRQVVEMGRERDSTLDCLFDASVPILIVDTSHTVTFCNTAFQLIAGIELPANKFLMDTPFVEKNDEGPLKKALHMALAECHERSNKLPLRLVNSVVLHIDVIPRWSIKHGWEAVIVGTDGTEGDVTHIAIADDLVSMCPSHKSGVPPSVISSAKSAGEDKSSAPSNDSNVLGAVLKHSSTAVREVWENFCSSQMDMNNLSVKERVELQTMETEEAEDKLLDIWADRFFRLPAFSTGFNLSVMVLVGANIAAITVEIDSCPGECEPETAQVLGALAHMFCAAFLLELCVRLLALGPKRYCTRFANVMDLVLVVATLFDVWLLPLFNYEGNTRLLSVMRIFRLLRVLRLLKVARRVKAIWILLLGFKDALASLAAALLLMLMMIFSWAILGTQLIGHNKNLESALPRHGEMFGTVVRSMWTLLGCLVDGCFDTVMVPCSTVEPLLSLYFLVFLGITFFGLMNIIVAVFCETCMETARNKLEVLECVHNHREQTAFHALKELWAAMDTDGDDRISHEELREAMKAPEANRCLSILGLEALQAQELLMVLDHTHSGHVSAEAFINGVMMLKRHNVNSASTLIINRRMEALMDKMRSDLDAVKDAVTQSPGQLHRDDVVRAAISSDDKAKSSSSAGGAPSEGSAGRWDPKRFMNGKDHQSQVEAVWC